MGTWSVISAVGRHTLLDTATNFGVNFYVTFRIKYAPATFGSFTEPPKLAWDEVIQFNDYKDKERWQFIGNMYTHKPAAPRWAFGRSAISGPIATRITLLTPTSRCGKGIPNSSTSTGSP